MFELTARSKAIADQQAMLAVQSCLAPGRSSRSGFDGDALRVHCPCRHALPIEWQMAPLEPIRITVTVASEPESLRMFVSSPGPG